MPLAIASDFRRFGVGFRLVAVSQCEHRQSTEPPTLLDDLTPWRADHRPTAEEGARLLVLCNADLTQFRFGFSPMSPEDLRQTERFCSPQDQIQWGILSLSRHLWGLSPWEREEYLHEEWEWGRQQGDLLRMQIVRDYRECRKESGPTYRRHQDWFFNQLGKTRISGGTAEALPQVSGERTTESVWGNLHEERNRHCGFDGRADPL
jgi:hypothetical protein